MTNQLTVTTALSPEEADSAAGDFVKASKSAATRKAYQSDARAFAAWCSEHDLEPLPASVETVAASLAALASSGLKAQQHHSAGSCHCLHASHGRL